MDKWLVIHDDQTYELKEKPEEQSKLEFMQEIVGGYIEVVRNKYLPAYCLVVDEEGRLKEKMPNLAASVIDSTGNLILGTVIPCWEEDGELQPLETLSVQLTIDTFNLKERDV